MSTAEPCERPGESRDPWISGRSDGGMDPGLRRGG
jgi:hypothetical protein